MNYDFKSDSAIFSYLILRLLPDSKKGKWTSFEEIMDSNQIYNHKIPKRDIIRILHKEVCSFIIWKEKTDLQNITEEGGEGWKYCIDPNDFYTLEERQQPTYSIRNLEKG
jgi:hypothetical protein